ncbi:hypothetical protein [Anaerosporobacter sp.]
MPWCPKCNMEYREGIKVCADCGTELIEEATEGHVSESEVVRLEKEEDAQKLIQFLDYSKINQASYSYDEKDQSYVVVVNENDLSEAKKLFQAFYIAETEEEKSSEENVESTTDKSPNSSLSDSYDADIDDEDYNYEKNKNNSSLNDMKAASKSSTVYVRKADQFKDLRSTAYIFIAVGFGGLVVLLLNIFGVLSFYQGYFAWIIMGLLFTSFLIIGFGTLKHSKQVKGQIDEENALTDAINTWLEKNITKEVLDRVIDPNEADEINYFKQTEYIKNGILETFDKNLVDSYVDLLVEEFYNSHFAN